MSVTDFEAITFTAYPEQTAGFTADARLNERRIENEEPFRSRYYDAGKLHIPQGMLGQAMQECAGLPEPVAVSFYGGEQHWTGAYPEISPFLQGFLAASETRLRDFVHKATGVQKDKLICSAQAGPYCFTPDNNWHRDSRDTYGRVYVVAPFGQTTSFSLGSYTSDQFDYGDSLLPNVYVQNPRQPQNNVITLQNEATTVHRAPLKNYEGFNRLHISCLFGKEKDTT